MYPIYLLHLALLSQRYPTMLFWAFVTSGNSKMASYVQLCARESGQAEVYQISDYRKVA